jgi:hypothetical protein
MALLRDVGFGTGSQFIADQLGGLPQVAYLDYIVGLLPVVVLGGDLSANFVGILGLDTRLKPSSAFSPVARRLGRRG